MENTYSVCSESIFKQSEKEKKYGKYIFFFLVRDFFFISSSCYQSSVQEAKTLSP